MAYNYRSFELADEQSLQSCNADNFDYSRSDIWSPAENMSAFAGGVYGVDNSSFVHHHYPFVTGVQPSAPEQCLEELASSSTNTTDASATSLKNLWIPHRQQPSLELVAPINGFEAYSPVDGIGTSETSMSSLAGNAPLPLPKKRKRSNKLAQDSYQVTGSVVPAETEDVEPHVALDALATAACALWMVKHPGTLPSEHTVSCLAHAFRSRMDVVSRWFSLNASVCHEHSVHNPLASDNIVSSACALWHLKNPRSRPSQHTMSCLSHAFGGSSKTLQDSFNHETASSSSDDSGYHTMPSRDVDVATRYRLNRKSCLSKTRTSVSGSTDPPARHPSRPYACTSRCGKCFSKKDAFKRHEEINFLQQIWLCQFEGCPFKSESKRVYCRKDRFRKHLRTEHPNVRLTQSKIARCAVPIPSNYDKQCILRGCDTRFSSWNARINHIAKHFEGYWTYADWKDEAEMAQASDEDEDDDQQQDKQDFDESGESSDSGDDEDDDDQSGASGSAGGNHVNGHSPQGTSGQYRDSSQGSFKKNAMYPEPGGSYGRGAQTHARAVNNQAYPSLGSSIPYRRNAQPHKQIQRAWTHKKDWLSFMFVIRDLSSGHRSRVFEHLARLRTGEESNIKAVDRWRSGRIKALQTTSSHSRSTFETLYREAQKVLQPSQFPSSMMKACLGDGWCLRNPLSGVELEAPAGLDLTFRPPVAAQAKLDFPTPTDSLEQLINMNAEIDLYVILGSSVHPNVISCSERAEWEPSYGPLGMPDLSIPSELASYLDDILMDGIETFPAVVDWALPTLVPDRQTPSLPEALQSDLRPSEPTFAGCTHPSDSGFSPPSSKDLSVWTRHTSSVHRKPRPATRYHGPCLMDRSKAGKTNNRSCTFDTNTLFTALVRLILLEPAPIQLCLLKDRDRVHLPDSKYNWKAHCLSCYNFDRGRVRNPIPPETDQNYLLEYIIDLSGELSQRLLHMARSNRTLTSLIPVITTAAIHYSLLQPMMDFKKSESDRAQEKQDNRAFKQVFKPEVLKPDSRKAGLKQDSKGSEEGELQRRQKDRQVQGDSRRVVFVAANAARYTQLQERGGTPLTPLSVPARRVVSKQIRSNTTHQGCERSEDRSA